MDSEQRMAEPENQSELLAMAARIVAAHVSSNSVAASDLPKVIADVYRGLVALGSPPVIVTAPQPAVPVKRSVTADYVICLECGTKLKMLKRHLQTAHDIDPEAYRERWSLAADHPLVATNYARHRSALAKKIGLGTRARPQ